VHRHLAAALALPLLALGAIAVSACEGCRAPPPTVGAPDGTAEASPTARLYLLSDVAGALEPCGCVKDQLGGVDHLGALLRNAPVAGTKGDRSGQALLAAGPLYFMDMELAADRRSQEITKAQTLRDALAGMGLVAFAPGRNDWAGGARTLEELTTKPAPAVLAANVSTELATRTGSTVVEVGSLRIGVFGVAAPDKAKLPLAGATSADAIAAARKATDELKAQGVHGIVALAAVGRGEAKRIADAIPELLAVVVGSTGGGGEANTQTPPAEQIGGVLVIETANHVQTVAELDLFVREAPGGQGRPALVKFKDGTGIDRLRKREELTGRIDDLRKRVATWETDKSVDARDVAARRADLTKLEAERDALEKAPPPESGSYYRYAVREVRESLGADDATKQRMLAYYKKVNDANKLEFASRVPSAPAKGEPGYGGIDLCTNCHEDERKVWDGTAHAHAYATLSKQFKEFNLDCVSCHVTGYDRPGGSTVTHVTDLENVQCENCHGPGKLHAAKPDKVKIPVPKPNGDVCLSCHHPPHVHTFDPKAKMADILGPGHGKPKP